MLNKIKSSVVRSLMLLLITQTIFGMTFSAYAEDSTSVTIEGTTITSLTTSGTSGGSGTGVNVTYNYEGALGSITSSLLSSGQKFRTGDMNGDGVPDIVVEKLVSSVKYLDLYIFRNGGYELASTVDTKTIASAFLGQGQASETGQLYSGIILALNSKTKELCAPVYADYIAGKENLTDGSDYKKKLLPCLRKMNASTDNSVRVIGDPRINDSIYLGDELFLKIPINYTDAYGIDYYFIKDESGKGKLIVQVSFVGNQNNSDFGVKRMLYWPGGLPIIYPYESKGNFAAKDSDGVFLYSASSNTPVGHSSRYGFGGPGSYLDPAGSGKFLSAGNAPGVYAGRSTSWGSYLRTTGSNKFAGLTLVLQTTTDMLNKSLEITGFSSGKIGDTSYAALGYSTLSSKLITKADVNGDGVEDITVYKTDPKINANIAAIYLYNTAQQVYVYSSGSGTLGSSGVGLENTLNQDINNDTQEDVLFTSKSGDYTTATYYINNAGTYNLALTIPEATIIEYKDLNQDDNTTLKGAKDIITTKKVNDKLFYKVYIYNKTSKTFISVLDSASTNLGEIEALSYLIQDVNGDGNLDIIFKKNDGKLYIYTYDTNGTGTTGDVADSMKLLTSIDGDEFKFLTLDNNTSRDLVTRKYLGLFGGKKYYKFDVYFYDGVTKSYVKQHDENLLLGTDINLFTDQDKAADLIDYNKDNIKDIVLEGATTKGIYYYSSATNKYIYLNKVKQTDVLADYLLYNDQTNTFSDDRLILVDNTGKVRHYYFDSPSKLYVDAVATYNGATYSDSPINVNFGTKKLTDPKEFKSFTVNGKKIWVMRDKDNKLVIFKAFSTIKPNADNIVSGVTSNKDLNSTSDNDFVYYKYNGNDHYFIISENAVVGLNNTSILPVTIDPNLFTTTNVDGISNSMVVYNGKNTVLNVTSTTLEKNKGAYLTNSIMNLDLSTRLNVIQKIITLPTIFEEFNCVYIVNDTPQRTLRRATDFIGRGCSGQVSGSGTIETSTFNWEDGIALRGTRGTGRTINGNTYSRPKKYISSNGELVKYVTLLTKVLENTTINNLSIPSNYPKNQVYTTGTTIESLYPLSDLDTTKEEIITVPTTTITTGASCITSSSRITRRKTCDATYPDGSIGTGRYCVVRPRSSCTITYPTKTITSPVSIEAKVGTTTTFTKPLPTLTFPSLSLQSSFNIATGQNGIDYNRSKYIDGITSVSDSCIRSGRHDIRVYGYIGVYSCYTSDKGVTFYRSRVIDFRPVVRGSVVSGCESTTWGGRRVYATNCTITGTHTVIEQY